MPNSHSQKMTTAGTSIGLISGLIVGLSIASLADGNEGGIFDIDPQTLNMLKYATFGLFGAASGAKMGHSLPNNKPNYPTVVLALALGVIFLFLADSATTTMSAEGSKVSIPSPAAQTLTTLGCATFGIICAIKMTATQAHPEHSALPTGEDSPEEQQYAAVNSPAQQRTAARRQSSALLPDFSRLRQNWGIFSPARPAAQNAAATDTAAAIDRTPPRPASALVVAPGLVHRASPGGPRPEIASRP